MIERLKIENLVLVERAEIVFGPQLNILTGETGAGKSAILAAIRLILGERADAQLIRKGAESALIEATVRLKQHPEELDLPPPGSPLLIRRELSPSGRSRTFIEDSQISLHELRSLMSHAIELVDQSASIHLRESEQQRTLLDLFAGIEPNPLATEFSACTATRTRLEKLTARLLQSEKEKERWAEDLAFLDHVDWKEGEEERLTQEHTLLVHAQELAEKIAGASSLLSEGQEPILPLVKRLTTQMHLLQKIDPKIRECAEWLHSAAAHLEESARFFISYLDRLDADPARLDLIEKRIAAIESVKRRFSPSFEQNEKLRKELKQKLLRIDSLDTDIETAKAEYTQAEQELTRAAEHLTHRRTTAAHSFIEAVLTELRTLNLPHAAFSVQISSKTISANGADEICFLFTANPGTLPLPLDQCASGGELSRLLFAIKVLLAGKEGSTCLVFDEIDSNVGGKTAAILGEKLQTLAISRQLICVTHFVQVARYAMRHFLVRKISNDLEAKTEIAELLGKQRDLEFARMTGNEI